jgi:hypothetical protein
MIAVEEQALLRLWAQRSGLGRGNAHQQWLGLTPAEQEAYMAQARQDLALDV